MKISLEKNKIILNFRRNMHKLRKNNMNARVECELLIKR